MSHLASKAGGKEYNPETVETNNNNFENGLRMSMGLTMGKAISVGLPSWHSQKWSSKMGLSEKRIPRIHLIPLVNHNIPL